MAGNVQTSIRTSGSSTPSMVKSPSPHYFVDPDTSTDHIRFATPPSILSSSASKRVRTRPETPSALAILAAVCSSPSVRWDGVKHQYGEGHGKSIWCEDLRMAGGPSHQAHIVNPSSPKSPLVYGEHSFTFRGDIKGDMESYGIADMGRVAAVKEMRSSTVEHQIIGAPKLSVEQDYFSENSSSPPALVFSSPLHDVSYDLSSPSEVPSTLSLSSPSPNEIQSLPITGSAYDTHSGDVADSFVLTPQESSFNEIVKVQHGTMSVPSTSVEGRQVITPSIKQPIFRAYDAETFLTDREPIRSPSLSPLHAPEPLPRVSLELSSSPLSSLLSSPLSEILDEPSSPAATRSSVISEAVSVRSISPDTDNEPNYSRNSKAAGRRASVNIVGRATQQMSGVPSSQHRQRSDTAPPESMPSKRPRRSPSLVPRPFQAHRLASSPLPSPYSDGSITSKVALEDDRPARKRQKHKIQPTGVSMPTKTKRSIDRPQSSDLHRLSKRNKGKSSLRSPDGRSDVDAITSEFRALSSTELSALPVTGFLVETLALSRASTITAPELLRAVLKSQRHLMEERSEKAWLELVRCILEKVTMFGRIERRGTDAADRPLEDQWFYIPENDKESGRAELLRGLMPKKRDVTKRSKQYYFEPVQKVLRWDPDD